MVHLELRTPAWEDDGKTVGDILRSNPMTCWWTSVLREDVKVKTFEAHRWLS